MLRDVEGESAGTLLATGSEVALALAAADRLAKDGIALRVVSMPCAELFDEQPEDYRRGVLPGSAGPVIAVEAGRGETLQKYVGSGFVYGINRFGASAPAAEVAATLGFTPEKLEASIRKHLEGRS